MIDHDYPGRFALLDASAADAVQIPADWIWRQSGNLRLATEPQLPVLDIASADGRSMGWLLGYPIDPDTQTLLAESLRLPNDKDAFEPRLYCLGGRFAAIVVTDQWQRYYPDASGSLAAFLSSDKRLIASTPSMIRGLEPVDPDLASALQRATHASGTWYPLGFSGYRNTSVVLPNHHVDLHTWSPHRHWSGPSPADSRRTRSSRCARYSTRCDPSSRRFPKNILWPWT